MTKQGLSLLAMMQFLVFQVLQAAPASSNAVVLVELEGAAQVLRPSPPTWQEAHTNMALYPGDRFRTKTNARATFRLSDLSLVRVGEQCELEVQRPGDVNAAPVYKLWKGVLYFYHRDKPGSAGFRSPIASAAVKGTEFVFAVAEDGRTTLTLIEGTVDFGTEAGRAEVTSGHQSVAQAGQPPSTTPFVQADLPGVVQWALYYPAVLNLDDLKFPADAAGVLADSIAAYRRGDLMLALEKLPPSRVPVSDEERLYHAALLLAVGKVNEAEPMLSALTNPLVAALRRQIATVRNEPAGKSAPPHSATEWLVESYVQQAASHLREALAAARESVRESPQFGFGWARVAELEFGMAHHSKAAEALDQALKLAPRNAQALALRGFVEASRNDTRAALGWFDRAIETDGALANAWLGRGLCRIRQGDSADGLQDLQMAVVLEPQRSILRSYLAKAWNVAHQDKEAVRELDMARQFDANDPTPWLYAALLLREQNQINAAIRDLERSTDLNENRRIYRSQLLLDQDRAVRSSSLATLYDSAGLQGVSQREAARAVSADYANYSAHLFLSESFDALRDPTRFNLRYETPWFSEWLLANLLSPVGGTSLSQTLSQQEYARLFQKDRAGLSSSTEYRSDGQVRELASQFGAFGNAAWAFDLDYQHNDGVRPNNDLDRIEFYSTLKYQLSQQDSLLLFTKYQDYSSGDNFQYFNPDAASRHYRFDEFQKPIALMGYHREWSPGVHTLALGGLLQNEQQVSDRGVPVLLLAAQGTNLFVPGAPPFDVRYQSRFEAGTVELNQIFQSEHQILNVGGRYQRGTIHTENRFALSGPPDSNLPPADDSADDVFERDTAYAYYTLKPVASLALLGGVTYDRVRFPTTFRNPPITPGTDERDQIGPKAALTWAPAKLLTVRGAWSRSLGGVTLDQSYRLEPTQLAGFVQTFRTLIPESPAGSVNAQAVETAGVALDFKFGTGTYLGLIGERLESGVHRDIGVFLTDASTFPPPPAAPSMTPQTLRYLERSAGIALNQLVGEEWSFGLDYRFVRSELHTHLTEVSVRRLSSADQTEESDLHRFGIFALYNIHCGLFAKAELNWYLQENRIRRWDGSAFVHDALPGDEFPQLNLFAGWRFPRQRGDATVGVLNLTGEDYHLNPVNFYSELPRERVFYARLRFRF